MKKTAIKNITEIVADKEVFANSFLAEHSGDSLITQLVLFIFTFGANRLEKVVNNTYSKEKANEIIDKINAEIKAML